MNFTAQQVRAKARAAVRRREDEIEEEEIESGEINLIPYLDIVTNLMLFLLASVSTGTLLGQINTELPDKSSAAAPSTPAPDVKPEDQPLQLVLSVLRDRVELWSITGLEGTQKTPKATYNRTGRVGDACDGEYMCETNACVIPEKKTVGTCVASNEVPVPVFDYRAINKDLYEIAKARYEGRPRVDKTYQAILQADGATPYGTIISMMGAMRCKLPALGETLAPCMMPTADETLKAAAEPIDADARLYDTSRANYNPDTMAIFPEILFSTGFE
ncbi:MAG: biopolymer transporter ExbD [Kofleriaceae bacterium]